MWANAQRDGRPAEYRWHPLFNAAVWLTPTTRCCAVTLPRSETSWNLQGYPKLVYWSQPLYPFTRYNWLSNRFDNWLYRVNKHPTSCQTGLITGWMFVYMIQPVVKPVVQPDVCLSCKDIAPQSCAMVPIWRFLATFLRPVFSACRVQHVSDLHPKFALRPHHVWK